jgi:hypothetical protein
MLYCTFHALQRQIDHLRPLPALLVIVLHLIARRRECWSWVRIPLLKHPLFVLLSNELRPYLPARLRARLQMLRWAVVLEERVGSVVATHCFQDGHLCLAPVVEPH